MKTLIFKILPLMLMVLLSGAAVAQINTTATSVTSCPGPVVVPVTVTNCNGVGAISLILNFDNTHLTYTGYQNLNAALTVGMLIINSAGGKVVISWANTTATNLGNSTMVELKFTAVTSTTSLAWDTQTPGNCEYSDVNGNILPSTYASGIATINQVPVINTQPVDQIVLVGQNTSFTLSAAGTSIACLWQLSTDGGTLWNDLTNTAPYSGVTTPTLSLTTATLAYNGYKFRCRLTGTCTPVIYSNVVTLSVINPITTTLPTQSICPGSITVPLTVTNFTGVAAFSLTLSYNPAFMTYTGYQTLNVALSGGTLFANASGGKVYLTWASTAAASFGAGTIVELLFTGIAGTSSLSWDTSNAGNCEYTTLGGTEITGVFVNGSQTVYDIPAVTLNPSGVIVAKGQNTSFTTAASGSGLAYLWQLSTNGGGLWTNLSNGGSYTNVTNPTMNISNAQLSMSTFQYRCRVTGTCLPVVYSNAATLTVLPNILTSCGTVSGCPGEIIIPVNVTDFIGVGSFSLSLNYNPVILAYTGYQNLNGALGGSNFVINASSGTVYLTWSNTMASTIANGGLLIELKFTGIPGASTLTWDTQTPGNCEYTDINGQVIFSTWTNGSATINTPPAITADPVNKTIYAGGSTSFSVSAIGTGPGYLWQVTANGGLSWSNLTNVTPYSGVTSATLTVNPASTGMNGYLYHCIVSGTCTPIVTSNSAQLAVTQAAITTTPGSVSNSCTGNLNIPINVTNCSNVGSISLTLVFDTTKMTFEGYMGANAALSSGMLMVNRMANKVYMTWASTTAATIGTGTLIQYRFKASAGISAALSWDTPTPGACEYSDGSGNIMSSFYVNSNVSVAAGALIVSAGPDLTRTGSSVQLNGSATGGATPYTWLWAPAGSLSSATIPNPVASPAVTTAYTLTVTANNGCVGSDVMNVFVSGVSTDLMVQDIVIGSGTSNCYNALQTITVAGSSTSFVVQGGGSATMIAGLKINYLPGTQVLPNGYLHGYITASGQYCSSLPAAPVATAMEDRLIVPPDGSMFRIYPNPTTDHFTLELEDKYLSGDVYVTIYGTCGEMILGEGMTGESRREFSLKGKPAGFYFVRVVNGNNGYTKKLVRQ